MMYGMSPVVDRVYTYDGKTYRDVEEERQTLANDLMCDYSEAFQDEFQSWLDDNYTASALVEMVRTDHLGDFEETMNVLWDEFVDAYSTFNTGDVIKMFLMGDLSTEELD